MLKCVLKYALFLLAAILPAGVLPAEGQLPSFPQTPQARTRAQIHVDIRRTEMAIFDMKMMIETEINRVKPNNEVIQECAKQVAKTEAYLRRLWQEYAQAPY